MTVCGYQNKQRLFISRTLTGFCCEGHMELIGIPHGQNAELKVLNPFVRTYADH
jgi:hypothetical protein